MSVSTTAENLLNLEVEFQNLSKVWTSIVDQTTELFELSINKSINLNQERNHRTIKTVQKNTNIKTQKQTDRQTEEMQWIIDNNHNDLRTNKALSKETKH